MGWSRVQGVGESTSESLMSYVCWVAGLPFHNMTRAQSGAPDTRHQIPWYQTPDTWVSDTKYHGVKNQTQDTMHHCTRHQTPSIVTGVEQLQTSETRDKASELKKKRGERLTPSRAKKVNNGMFQT